MALRRKEAEQVMEAQTRVEKDATPSPGEPPEEPLVTESSENKKEEKES